MPLIFSPIELLVIVGLFTVGLPLAVVWLGRRLLRRLPSHQSAELEERVRRVEARMEDVADDVRRTEESQRFVADVLRTRGPR